VAYYKEARFLEPENGPEYDVLHEAGQSTPYSGIYRCEVCALCVTADFAEALPPQDHHQHQYHDAHPIRWRLVVKAHY
jgi:hypothetical protein